MLCCEAQSLGSKKRDGFNLYLPFPPQALQMTWEGGCTQPLALVSQRPQQQKWSRASMKPAQCLLLR